MISCSSALLGLAVLGSAPSPGSNRIAPLGRRRLQWTTLECPAGQHAGYVLRTWGRCPAQATISELGADGGQCYAAAAALDLADAARGSLYDARNTTWPGGCSYRTRDRAVLYNRHRPLGLTANCSGGQPCLCTGCVACPAGRYAAGVGARTACTLCSAGQYAGGTGRTGCVGAVCANGRAGGRMGASSAAQARCDLSPAEVAGIAAGCVVLVCLLCAWHRCRRGGNSSCTSTSRVSASQ